MKKFIVETYYTCTFKTVHKLNNLNDSELSKIDTREDGEVEVIDVKLNNRKTKKVGENTDKKSNKDTDKLNVSAKKLNEKILSKSKNQLPENSQNLNLRNKSRFKMPDRRKGYIQKLR